MHHTGRMHVDSDSSPCRLYKVYDLPDRHCEKNATSTIQPQVMVCLMKYV